MLKSDGLMLHPEFLQRLRSLPQAYVYGEYRQIYRDYGTHYITEAGLGGQYDYTIILNKQRLENSGTRTDNNADMYPLIASLWKKMSKRKKKTCGFGRTTLLRQSNPFTCKKKIYLT